MKLIDKQARKNLTEGRNYGPAFAFGKLEGDNLTLVGPISPCREYLNDQLGAELSKKPCSAWGYFATHQGLLDADRLYVVFAILPYFHGSKYSGQDKETKWTADNLASITSYINWFEIKMGVSQLSTIEKLEDNRYVIILSKWWGQATYMISLVTLLIRVCIESNWDGTIDPLKSLKECETTDSPYAPTAATKVEWIIANGGEVPPQKKTGNHWHEIGIYNFKFPALKAS